MQMQMQNLTRDLVARQLPAKNQASLAMVSKDWQNAVKPHLDVKRALVRVADVRRKAAYKHLVELLDKAMGGWVDRIRAGDVPEGFVEGPKWCYLKKYGMTLFIRRERPHYRNEEVIVVLEVPRQGLVLQISVDPLRMVLIHGDDNADLARMYKTQMWNEGISVPVRLELDRTLFADRPRRGNPRA